jgi:hypothetical protein
MPYLMCRKRYSSPAVGGGVRGKDVGTDPGTMTEGGLIMLMLHLFMQRCIRVGEMITGIIGGEGNRGIISGYLTGIFSATGVTGKETGTGAVEDIPVIPVEVLDPAIPVEERILVILVEVLDPGIPVEEHIPGIPVEVIPVEENLVEEDLVNTVTDLVNPVYNLVQIIREMEDDKRDRIEDNAVKLQSAA